MARYLFTVSFSDLIGFRGSAPNGVLWELNCYLSWPAVSQNCALILYSSISMPLPAKSTPIVAFESKLNSSFAYLKRRFDFPTPESPATISFSKKVTNDYYFQIQIKIFLVCHFFWICDKLEIQLLLNFLRINSSPPNPTQKSQKIPIKKLFFTSPTINLQSNTEKTSKPALSPLHPIILIIPSLESKIFLHSIRLELYSLDPKTRIVLQSFLNP